MWPFSKNPEGRNSPDDYLKPSALETLSKAREENKNAVFHGQCVTCVHLEGNNSGEGMRYCFGCAISTWSEYKPNRRLAFPRKESI